MKKLLLFFGTAILLAACGDVEPLDPSLNPNAGGATPGGNTGNSFTAKIDGRDFISTESFAGVATNSFFVRGAMGTASINLSLSTAQAGTYDFNLANTINGGGGFYIPENNGSRNPYIAVDGSDPTVGTGTITFSFNADRTRVTGTFNMIAKRQQVDAAGNFLFDATNNPIAEQVVITDGRFNLPVIPDNAIPSGNNTGTLRIANVDRNIRTLRSSLMSSTPAIPESISIVFETDDDNLLLVLESNIATGTFDVTGASPEISSVLNEDIVNNLPTIIYTEDSGTVTITAHNRTARTLQGSFNIAYSGLVGSGNTTASGTFSITY